VACPTTIQKKSTAKKPLQLFSSLPLYVSLLNRKFWNSGFKWSNSHLIKTDHVTDLTHRLKFQFHFWKRNLKSLSCQTTYLSQKWVQQDFGRKANRHSSWEKGGAVLDHHFSWFEKIRSRLFGCCPAMKSVLVNTQYFLFDTSKCSTNIFSSSLENTALQLEGLLKYQSDTNLLPLKNYGDEFGAHWTSLGLSVIQPAFL